MHQIGVPRPLPHKFHLLSEIIYISKLYNEIPILIAEASLKNVVYFTISPSVSEAAKCDIWQT
jgi:hypothetical protein